MVEHEEEGVGGPEEDVEEPHVHVVVIPVIGQTTVSVLHNSKSVEERFRLRFSMLQSVSQSVSQSVCYCDLKRIALIDM